MTKREWEKLYLLAAIEVDGKKIHARIGLAREAIRERLQALEQKNKHRAEREQLQLTLTRLDVLQAESLEW